MMKYIGKFISVSIIFLVLFVISGDAYAYETDTVQFNATLGLGEYGFDSGNMGLDSPLAQMYVRAYGMLGLNLADVTMNGIAWTDNGRIGVTGTPSGGNFSFNLGLEYWAKAYYGIPALGLDYELDLLGLMGIPSLDLRLNDSQTFTPFLLDSSTQISDSLPPENVLDIDLSEILLPGVPFAGAGVTLDADMGLEETLSGDSIYFSNPGSSIDSESSTLAFTGSSSILSYYENANAEVIVGFWPGIYAEVGALRFNFTPVRIPFTVYSSDLPLPFNNSSVNFSSTTTSLNVSAVLSPSSNVPPYSSVNVSGTVTYNSGGNVPVGIVDIDTGENVYTAAINDGAFSRNISAPSSSRNISITAHDDTYGLQETIYRYISIEGQQSGNGYILHRTTMCRDVQSSSPYDPIDETECFRRSDVKATLWVHLTDLYVPVRIKVKWYDPAGNLYWESPSSWSDDPGPGAYYKWWKFWKYISIDGHSAAYRPGRWHAKLYIDHGTGWKYRKTEYFIIGYDFTEHRMAQDVQSSDPYMPIGETDVFYQTDEKALTWANFDNVAESVDIKWKWYEPAGSLDLEYPHTSDDPGTGNCYTWLRAWGWMNINGRSRANKCGKWSVDVYVKDPGGTYEKVYAGYFQILENPSVNPSVSVSANPSTPFETQSVTLNLMATDNTYLDTVELHWEIDGVEQTPEVSSNINNGQKNISRNIGSFSSSQQIEYWGVAIDTSGNRAESQHAAIAVLSEVVITPDRPSGEAYLQVGQSGTYTTGGSTTSFGHSVEYDFDWDDGTPPDWGTATQNHAWSGEGYYFVKARARCQTHTNRESGWSTPITVTVDSTNPIVYINTNGGADFETTEPNVVIEGTVIDPNATSGLASVSINTGATNESTLSNWRFTVDLVDGNNPLTITATDNASNSGEDTITITYIPYVPTPDIRVSESSHDYNSVVVGSYEDWILTIYNDGDTNLSITDFNGLQTTDFSLIGPPSLPFTIEPNDSNDLTVRFTPSSGAMKTAKLSIANDDPDENPTNVDLFGIGVPPIIYVDINSPNDLGSGTPDDPYRHIQHGINAAADGVEVRVAEGEYNESITMKDGVNLFGGYDANDWTSPSDPNANQTIVNWGGGSVISIVDASVTIDGFIIQNGWGYQNGGGIYCASNNETAFTVRISNNIIQNNTLDRGYGAGIYCDSYVKPVIVGNIIQNNTIADMDISTAGGGGIYCTGTDCEISGNVVVDNQINSWYGEYAFVHAEGGGIWVGGGLISDNTVLRNSVKAAGHWGGQHYVKGGGIYSDGPAIITRNLVEDNELLCRGDETESGSETSEAHGGGIYAPNSEITFNIVNGNTCHGNGGYVWQGWEDGANGFAYGGGIYAPGAVLANNLVTSNHAIGEGGDAGDPIWVYEPPCSSKGGDGIARGGGIYAPEATITNNTVAGNQVTGTGGQGYAWEDWGVPGEPENGISISEGAGIFADSNTVITNAIIWSNSPDQLAGQDCDNVTYCDIGDGTCCGQNDNICEEPLFVDPNNNDYHLQYYSPCIDAGDPNYVADANEFDIDGDARVIGGRIDIGADEYRYGELCDLYKDGIVNFQDFSILAYYWMDYICLGPDWCEGSDIDENQRVDFADLRTCVENWLWQSYALVFGSIGDKEIDEGANLTFKVITQDSNTQVFIEDHNLPSEPSFFDNIFSWTPTYDDAGSYQVTFIASDGQLQDSEKITITVHPSDTSPPIVTNCSPQPDSIQVPLNTLISLHVVDTGIGVDAASVTIDVNDNRVYAGDSTHYISTHGDCYRSGAKSDYEFIYQPKQNFEFDETVRVKINAKDLAGNPMDEYSYSFKTEMRSFP